MLQAYGLLAETRGDTLLHHLDSTGIAKSSANILYQSNIVLVKSYRPGVEHENVFTHHAYFVVSPTESQDVSADRTKP